MFELSLPSMCLSVEDNFFTGSAEMLMADAVSKLSAKTPGKEAVAMEAFAKSLRMVSFSALPIKILDGHTTFSI